MLKCKKRNGKINSFTNFKDKLISIVAKKLFLPKSQVLFFMSFKIEWVKF